MWCPYQWFETLERDDAIDAVSCLWPEMAENERIAFAAWLGASHGPLSINEICYVTHSTDWAVESALASGLNKIRRALSSVGVHSPRDAMGRGV